MTTFYADVSEFQNVVDGSYPYPVFAFRLDNGGRIDYHAVENWDHAKADPRIQVVIAYVVFQPGHRAQILDRVKRFFGPHAPAKLVLMIDMESGAQFAGPGNHSSEANSLALDFAAYLGTPKRVLGYANQYDFRSCWPSRPGWLKLVTASYGASNPGTFGWQFYGGVPNPHPAGYPTSCHPFGSQVDLNAIQLPIDSIITELGLGADVLLTDKVPNPNTPGQDTTVQACLEAVCEIQATVQKLTAAMQNLTAAVGKIQTKVGA
jgi:hypothetical protein